ncbi:MAG: NFACT RNA binding domain-containing protein [Pleomorphochaeta sp.]
MSLNWKELELIVSELPLKNSRIQKVIQHDFHSLSWILHSSSTKQWTLYTELNTPYARIHRSTKLTSPPQGEKTKKLQRFVQFCRANVEGALIIDSECIKGDRILKLTLRKRDTIFYIYFRLYSGPAANILIVDENNIILDSLYRRPNRGDVTNGEFKVSLPKVLNDKFNIRERDEKLSFNEQIEKEYGQISTEFTLEQLVAKVEAIKDNKLKKLEGSVTSLYKRLQSTKDFESIKKEADLLSAYLYLVKPNSSSITLTSWEDNSDVTLKLNPNLTKEENLNELYEKYHKNKGSYNNALEQWEKAKEDYEKAKNYFNQILTLSDNEIQDIRKLKKALKTQEPTQKLEKNEIGLSFISGKFTILVGRNAKENDQLLRKKVKGNDYWLHTRDYSGGYVFIKFIRNKTVPLDVLLDAANLAIFYSKARGQKVCDLYYTQVKYLRRAKNGPLGLVLPTQEKNLNIKYDEKRLNTLLK